MDIVSMIKDCKSDEELLELTNDCIDTFTKQAYRENANYGFIGDGLEINPVFHHLDDPNSNTNRCFRGVNVWFGYIPKGMKIVYGRSFDPKFNTSSHKGYYYYLDDESYVYDFFKFVKDYDIEDTYDILICISEFIKNKFSKFFEPKDRIEMNKLIYRDEDFFFNPVKEHSIKDFYSNGSARCTEISLIAENLLACFGFEAIYLMDKDHAYNIFADHYDDETIVNVVDFSEWVECYNIKGNLIGYVPFIAEIDDGISIVDKIVNEGKRVSFPDYYYVRIGDSMLKVILEETREYGTDFDFAEEKSLILKRKINS